MTVQVPQEVKTHVAGPSYETLQAEYLLKRLVDQIVLSTTQRPASIPVFERTAQCVDEILLELDCEDAHYYVVRRRPFAPVHVSLSPREHAIADLVAKGLPNKTIGDVLEISPWTVATHLRRMFAKLDVTSRAALVARLLEEHVL